MAIPIEGKNAVNMMRAMGGSPRRTKKSGIDCPECEEELLLTEPNVVHQRNPPQMRVKCSKCEYKGWVDV